MKNNKKNSFISSLSSFQIIKNYHQNFTQIPNNHLYPNICYRWSFFIPIFTSSYLTTLLPAVARLVVKKPGKFISWKCKQLLCISHLLFLLLLLLFLFFVDEERKTFCRLNEHDVREEDRVDKCIFFFQKKHCWIKSVGKIWEKWKCVA